MRLTVGLIGLIQDIPVQLVVGVGYPDAHTHPVHHILAQLAPSGELPSHGTKVESSTLGSGEWGES